MPKIQNNNKEELLLSMNKEQIQGLTTYYRSLTAQANPPMGEDFEVAKEVIDAPAPEENDDEAFNDLEW